MKDFDLNLIGITIIAIGFCLIMCGCGVKITGDSKEVTVDPAAFNKALKILSHK